MRADRLSRVGHGAEGNDQRTRLVHLLTASCPADVCRQEVLK